jgi:uncharacterized SAM-binding protein YcdF (DUF218 family)
MASDGLAQTFPRENDRHLAAAAQSFFKKVKSFGDAQSRRRAIPGNDGTPNVADQRIRGAGNGLNRRHAVLKTNILYNVDIRITHFRRSAILALMALAMFAIGYLCALSVRIHREAGISDARPADVIIVMGAAEYSGRPSPVLKLRLDHALQLYQQKMAPYVMTTGGPGGDPSFTEGGVGRSYLVEHGVPAEMIIVESSGDSTVYSLAAASEILKRMGLRSVIVVSDGYHMFRVKRILAKDGLTAYSSPREDGGGPAAREWWLCFRQAVGYGLWRIGVPV